MESLSVKLKKNSTFSKNLFNSSIKKCTRDQGMLFAKTNEVQMSPSEGKVEKIDEIEGAMSTFPAFRKKQRFSSLEPGSHVPDQLKKSSLNPGVNFVDVPLDFTRSLTNSCKGKLISRNEDSEEIGTDRLEHPIYSVENKKPFKEERKIFSDFHLFSNKISLNSRQNSDLLSRTGSFDIENSDFSIISNKVERLSLRPYIKVEDNRFEDSPVKAELNDPPTPKLRKQNRSQTEIVYLDFNEALHKFNAAQVSFMEVNLWIRGFFEKLCCWVKDWEFVQEYQELCEKLIIFAYTEFDSANVFHASLIISVYHSLQGIAGSGSWEQAGFICNNPYENELKHNVANFGLLLAMFLVDFLPSSVENMLDYCKKQGLAFVSIVFDVAEISILSLRMRILNKIMMESQKCLEIVFFFAAGCLSEWFLLHKDRVNINKIGKKLQKRALSDPKGLINLARDLMCLQV